MTKTKIDLIAAARPNFMKVAPLYRALARESSWCSLRLVHTGQHYDVNMSDNFFRDLGLPQPDIQLGVGSGTHAEQTAGVMVAYEKVCLNDAPDWAVVVGDVNSTLACTLAATKLGVKVAHLEAGLRSGDRSMPEELNRLATDALADLLWTPSADGDANLLREGVPRERIVRVGNIMIDSLVMMRPSIEARKYYAELGLARAPRRAKAVGPPRGRVWREVARAGGLRGFHEPGVQRRLCAHGFGRRAGRNHVSRHSLPDAAR